MKDYSKAFVEVLEILKYIPKEEYDRIPEEKINFFKENMDLEYKFNIDLSKKISEQELSEEAHAIIVTIFRDCFATDVQKEKLEKILDNNQRKLEQKRHEKYNPDNIFETKEKVEKNTGMIEKKDIKEEKFYKKIFNFIKKILKIN